MKRHALIVVCSTSGNGDAPENASRFVRHIKKPPTATTSMPLEHVAYAVLGLGDTNYDKFCEASKVIDKKLHEWGAKRGMALTCADEATGLEEAVEPWLENVLINLEKACTVENDDSVKEVGDIGEATNVLNEEVKEKLVISSSAPAQFTSNAATDHAARNGQSTKSILSPDDNTAQSNDKIITNPISTTLPNKSPTPLYILYGSATGNSEHIAKDLCSTYQSYLSNPSFLGYFPSVTCCELNQFKKKCLDAWSTPPDPTNLNIKHGIIIVCSTTGNANAPENADRFLRWLKREPTKIFQHCAYAILGLGDSNYDVFNAMGKVIDKRLNELGGTRALKVALADEATGLEEVVDPWVGSVIGKLSVACRGQNELVNTIAPTPTHVGSTVSSPPRKIASASTASTSVAPPKAIVDPHTFNDEEKKMDTVDEIIAPNNNASSTMDNGVCSMGVWAVRKLLSLSPDDPLPTIPNSSLPNVMTSLSSCELIHEDANGTTTHRARGGSIADNMTVSSASSGYLYTFNSPYESKILNARYLTATDVECAKKVAKDVLVPPEASTEDEKILNAMKMYDEYFPLSSSPVDNKELQQHQQHLRCEKNGKRVIEMVCSSTNFAPFALIYCCSLTCKTVSLWTGPITTRRLYT